MEAPWTGVLGRGEGDVEAAVKRFSFVLFSMLLAGCAIPGVGEKPKEKAGGDFMVTNKSRQTDSLSDVQTLSSSPDPASVGTKGGVQVEVYAVSVPRGDVSANEEFWKRVDEDSLIDHGRYEVLFANGFRVGVARADQWDYFKRSLEKSPAKYQRNLLTVTDEQSVEVPVRQAVAEENLSFFSAGNPLELKSYTDSDNILALSFLASPNRGDSCRVALTPVVRSTKERLTYTQLNDEVRVKYAAVERLYDLNFTAEIPFGSFLVVSPSTDVARSSSIGRNFLLVDDTAEQHELVLLVVPTKVELKPIDGPARSEKSERVEKTEK